MQAAYGRNIGGSIGEGMGGAAFRASFPEPVRPMVRASAFVDAQPLMVSRFGEELRPNWAAILFIIGLHALLLTVLVKMDMVQIKRIKAERLVVNLIPDVAPPPPVEQEVAPPEAVDPPIVAPKAVVAPAPPAPAPATPVAVPDLAAGR